MFTCSDILHASWELEKPVTPAFLRYKDAFEHSIKLNGSVADDLITFNTQRSTQWDGLRHFAYQKEQLWYNGATQDDIIDIKIGKSRLGINWWHKAGGVAGRGVLVDYWSYAVANGKQYDAVRPHGIKYDDLMACFQWQQQQQSPEPLELKTGDILLIRSGFHAQYAELGTKDEREVGEAWPPASCGVDQDLRLLKWLWDSHVAAVGGDSPAWEGFPSDGEAGFTFHEVLLAGWGCPIAEMLWLEDLAASCRERKRWTFFLTSAPLNVHGGVASPANMLALA
ncbi:hypothetical protein J7T55_005393 [Diaporthe amygdali]|uniref:uncharacterized protein n=1 Tax=Phomopsis amygdali TaxID=1214568 RepID=UPI0022FDCE2F|nr:uncharacterized protein J7T55_005393 [Diaporthe amygdali]KAJ0108416.1 hypothetical protein J7T55_005393 [Diaporthe amygdali]